jgi:predicted amino acid racemase
METILIQSDSKTIKMLKNLAERMGDKATILSKTQMEDLALGQMMKKAKTGKSVSREAIMNELRS